MSNTTIERPVAGDPVSWPTTFGRVSGWLVRYLTDAEALCELKRGGLMRVPVADLRVDQ